jgi:23S rRNA maturation-related 3'-5' exoribonuclease YhaM
VFRVDNNDNNDTGTPSDRATILDGTQNALQHVSENEFLEIPADKVLHNNFGGGLDALYEQVDDAIQSVQLKL